MGLLTSKTPRFKRNAEYRLGEHRPATPTARISVVVPATHNRPPEQKGERSDDRS